MRILLLMLLSILLLVTGQGQEALPTVDGFVTSVNSSTDFAVDGTRIVLGAKTRVHGPDGLKIADAIWASEPYVGQPLKIFGTKNHKTQIVTAKEILVQYETVTPKDGFAVIDRVLSAPNGQSQIIVRADGYPILIDGKTKIRFSPPLASMADITTNVWIEFKGQLQPEGHIVATQAAFTVNTVGRGESKLRNKNEYDPAAVDPKDKQSEFSKEFLGTNMKKIPPHQDPTIQARIDRIGGSLVPEYQRAMAVTDPTKINFRFQLIAQKWNYPVETASGIVLIPKQVIERMQNDAQVAAILAYAMAGSLEKRDYRDLSARRAVKVGEWATILQPGAQLALLGASSVIDRHDMEQSARVSLGLLHDAKYDLDQAPLAWWILASNKPKDLAKITLPEKSRYMYQMLGAIWKMGQMAVPSP